MLKTDLLTGEQFHPKRCNQNFANTQNRIKYYNEKAKHLRLSTTHINKPLHTNLKILNGLLEKKKEATFHKEFLLGKGFDFCLQTHYMEYQGKVRPAIYHYTLVDLGQDKIKIVRHD